MSDIPPTQRIAGMGPRPPQPGPPVAQRTVNPDTPSPQPIGGFDPNMKMLQSLDGFVDSVSAAAYEIREAVKQMRAMNERTQRYYATTTGSTATPGVQGMGMPVISQLMGNVMSQTMSSMGFNIIGPQLQQILHGQRNVIEHFQPIAGGPGVPEVHDEARHHRQRAAQRQARESVAPPDTGPRHEIPEDIDDPTLSEGHYTSLERYRRARDAAPHSIGELRQRAIGFAQKRLQQHIGARVRQRVAGQITEGGGDLIPGAGGDVGGIIAEQENMGSLAKGGQVLGALGEEGGMGALASILPEAAAGPVGWAAAAGTIAWEGVKRGTAFAQQQRAENARFQAIMGGSNLSGFGQRAQQAQFRYGQMGTLSGEQANQLFYGVTESGLRGGERQRGLDFAVREYKNLGMTIEDSLQVINVAVQHGKANFDDLSVTLRDVSDSAAKAGINTEAARKSFVATYESFAGAFGAQGGASTIAGALTQQTNANRQTQGINSSGIATNPGVIAMAATNAGMTPAQFMALGRSPSPQARLKFAQAVGGQEQMGATAALGAEGRQAILDAVTRVTGKQAPTNSNLTDDQLGVVVRQALGDPRMAGTLLGFPGGAMQVLQQMTGQSAPNDDAAMSQIINFVNNPGGLANQAKKDIANQHKAALGHHGTFTGGGILGQSGALSTDRVMGGPLGGPLGMLIGGKQMSRIGRDATDLLSGDTVGNLLRKIPGVGGALGTIEQDINPLHWARSPLSHVPVVGGFFGKPSGKQGAQAAYSELAARHPDVFKGSEGQQTQAELDWMVSQHGGENVHWTDDKGKVHSMSQAGFIKQYGADRNMVGKARVGKTGVSLGTMLDQGLPTDKDTGGGKDGGTVNAKVTVSAKPDLQRWLNFMGSGQNAPSPNDVNMPPPNQAAPGFGPSGQP